MPKKEEEPIYLTNPRDYFHEHHCELLQDGTMRVKPEQKSEWTNWVDRLQLNSSTYTNYVTVPTPTNVKQWTSESFELDNSTSFRAYSYAQLDRSENKEPPVNMYYPAETIRQLIHYDREVLWTNAVLLHKQCPPASCPLTACQDFLRQWHSHLHQERMLDVVWPVFTNESPPDVKQFPPFSPHSKRLRHHKERKELQATPSDRVPFPSFHIYKGEQSTFQQFYDEIQPNEPYSQGTLLQWEIVPGDRSGLFSRIRYTSASNPYPQPMQGLGLFQISLGETFHQKLSSIQIPLYLHSQLDTYTWLKTIMKYNVDDALLLESKSVHFSGVDFFKAVLQFRKQYSPAQNQLPNTWWVPHIKPTTREELFAKYPPVVQLARCGGATSNSYGHIDPKRIDVLQAQVPTDSSLGKDENGIFVQDTDNKKEYIYFTTDQQLQAQLLAAGGPLFTWPGKKKNVKELDKHLLEEVNTQNQISIPSSTKSVSEQINILIDKARELDRLTDICQQYRYEPNPFHKVYRTQATNLHLMTDSYNASLFTDVVKWPEYKPLGLTFTHTSVQSKQNPIDNVNVVLSPWKEDHDLYVNTSIRSYLARKYLQKAILAHDTSVHDNIASFGLWTTLAIGKCEARISRVVKVVLSPIIIAFRKLRMGDVGWSWFVKMCQQIVISIRGAFNLTNFTRWMQSLVRFPATRLQNMITWATCDSMTRFMKIIRPLMRTRDACLLIDHAIDYVRGIELNGTQTRYISRALCYYTVSSLCKRLHQYGMCTHHYLMYFQDMHTIRQQFFTFHFNGENDALGQACQKDLSRGKLYFRAWNTFFGQLFFENSKYLQPLDVVLLEGPYDPDVEEFIANAAETQTIHALGTPLEGTVGNLGLSAPARKHTTSLAIAGQNYSSDRGTHLCGAATLPTAPEEDSKDPSHLYKQVFPQDDIYAATKPGLLGKTEQELMKQAGIAIPVALLATDITTTEWVAYFERIEAAVQDQLGNAYTKPSDTEDYTLTMRDLITNSYSYRNNNNQSVSFSSTPADVTTLHYSDQVLQRMNKSIEITRKGDQITAKMIATEPDEGEQDEGEQAGEDTTVNLPDGVMAYLQQSPSRSPAQPSRKGKDGHWKPTYNCFFTIGRESGETHRFGFDYYTVDKLFVKLLDLKERGKDVTVMEIFTTKNNTELAIQKVSTYQQSDHIVTAMNHVISSV